MDEIDKNPPTKVGIYVKLWLILLGVLFASSFALDRFDTFTVIIPDDNNSINTCFVIAGSAAFANAILGWRMAARGQLRGGVGFLNRVLASFGFLFFGFMFVFFAVVPLMNIIEGTIEFPAAKIRSFQGALLISRAYEMHGKGKSWHIQTQPNWTDIDITQQDFRFMQAHRRQDDLSGKSDEIQSDGYFCANVTLQSAGAALRVVHAGRSTLPKGSVGVCRR